MSTIDKLKQAVRSREADEAERQRALDRQQRAETIAKAAALIAKGVPADVLPELGDPHPYRWAAQEEVWPERALGFFLVPGHLPLHVMVARGGGRMKSMQQPPDLIRTTWSVHRYFTPVSDYLAKRGGRPRFEAPYDPFGTHGSSTSSCPRAYMGEDLGLALAIAERGLSEVRVEMSDVPAPHAVTPGGGGPLELGWSTYKRALSVSEDWLSRQLFPAETSARPLRVVVEVEVIARSEDEALHRVRRQVVEGKVTSAYPVR